MTSTFYVVLIGASPIQLSTVIPFTGGVCKLRLQAGTTPTGTIKVGGSPTMTADDTTGGIYVRTPSVVSPWSIESDKDLNDIFPQQYYVHGTVPGDPVMLEVNQA
jgi:hypothetical protein